MSQTMKLVKLQQDIQQKNNNYMNNVNKYNNDTISILKKQKNKILLLTKTIKTKTVIIYYLAFSLFLVILISMTLILYCYH